MAKKRKNKYQNEDSLEHSKVPRVRAEFIDYDYKEKLSEKDHDWLAKFNSEYYGASVGYNPETGRAKAGQLHKKRDQIKGIYDDNNRRNNDVQGVTRVNRLLSDVDSEIKNRDGWYVFDAQKQENALIDDIDNQEDTLLSREEYEKLKHNLTFEMQMFYEAYFNEDMDLGEDDET